MPIWDARLGELTDSLHDGSWIETLVRNLLIKAAAPAALTPKILVCRVISALEQPSAEADAQPSVAVLALDEQNEGALAEAREHRFVDLVKGGLVHEPDVEAFLAQLLDCVECAKQHLAVADDEAGFPV